MIIRNRPHFFSGRVLQLSILQLIFNKYYFLKKKYPLFNRSLLTALRENRRIRRELHLTRIVLFNSQFYSSPVSPAYPSKAFDHSVANGALNYYEMGTENKKHLDSVFLAITDKCSLNCNHCYEKHNLKHDNSPAIGIETWKEVIENIQRKGAGIIILTGGEPFEDFEKIIKVSSFINKDQSDIHIHTSGSGVTAEKVMRIKEAGIKAVAVGLDDYNEQRFDRLRNRKGAFKDAVHALKLFNDAGIFTYLNTCVTKELIKEGNLYEYYEFAKSLNVGFIQLLEPRPFGGFNRTNIEDIFPAECKKQVHEFYINSMHNNKYKKYPIVYYVAEIESKDKMGCCMGGLSHFYIDCKGNVNPCVFLPVTFGNVLQNPFEDIYARMRNAFPKPLKCKCPSLKIGEKLTDKEDLHYPIHVDSINKKLGAFTFSELMKDDPVI